MAEIKSFWERNWQWVATIVFMAGVNYTVMANKIDREQARTIVKEELKESVYSRTDGKVLETRFDNIEKKLDNITILLESSGKTK